MIEKHKNTSSWNIASGDMSLRINALEIQTE
jgi:hypothetical protein